MRNSLKIVDIAKIMAVSTRSAKRALKNAGIPLQKDGRAYVVDEDDFTRFWESRRSYSGRGRPIGKKQSQEIHEHEIRILSKRLSMLAFSTGKSVKELAEMLISYAELAELAELAEINPKSFESIKL